VTQNTEIMHVDTTRQVIFESPDGGKTIYAREVSSLKRSLFHKDTEVSKEENLAIRSKRMLRIIRLAEDNPTLRDALEKLEMLYELVKDNENS